MTESREKKLTKSPERCKPKPRKEGVLTLNGIFVLLFHQLVWSVIITLPELFGIHLKKDNFIYYYVTPKSTLDFIMVWEDRIHGV